MSLSIAPSIETNNSFVKRQIAWLPLRRIFANIWQSVIDSYLQALDKELDESYARIRDILSIVRDYSQPEAEQDLPSVRTAIRLFSKFNASLEQGDYFGKMSLKEKITRILSVLYDVEIQMKKKAFAGKARVATDSTLLDALSEKSKLALKNSKLD